MTTIHWMHVPRRAAGGLALTTVMCASVMLGACGSNDSTQASCRPVTALVASSMKDALSKWHGNPCADAWRITTGSSTALAAQVQEGAPADVFLSAGTKAIKQLQDAGLTVGQPVDLGSVRAAIITSTEHRTPVSLQQLPALVRISGWKVGLCVASAPCGSMADSVLANATALWGPGYDRSSLVATEAESADALVAKVAMGEVDAAVIYEYVCVTPPNAESAVICNDIQDVVDGHELNVRTPYQAVRLRTGENADTFMGYVQSSAFKEVLRTYMRIS